MTEYLADEMQATLGRPEPQIDLGRAALVLAKLEYPDLDAERYLSKLDRLANRVGPGLPKGGTAALLIENLYNFLFVEHGFHGNAADYYDPRNSFLNDVIERRTGIPITLSVVYLEIARRLDLPFFGVGLPGHFVVKYDDGRQIHYIDVFAGGSVLDREGCRKLVASVLRRQPHMSDVDFAAVEKRDIIQRMLNNLRGIYLNSRQYRKAIAVLDITIALSSGAAELWKERGLLYYQMRDFTRARADLEEYLSLRPDAPDAAEVEKQMAGLQALLAMMN